MSHVIAPQQLPDPSQGPAAGSSVLPRQPQPPSAYPRPQQPAASHGRDLADRFRDGMRTAFEGTPGRLRVIALVVVLGCLIAGFGGASALRARSSALAQARSTLQHLVQLAQAETSLLEADAAITNSFLQGGLENPGQLATYRTSMDLASGQLASAARASDADARELGIANVSLARYAGLIQAARSTNRQGLPVGTNYLKDANRILSDEVIARLDRRAASDRARVDAALDSSSRAELMLVLAAMMGLALLIGAQWAMAQRTRRILNLPAVAATVVLALVLFAAALAMASVQSAADDARDGAYADTVNLTASRVAGFRAKSIESLGLISRGSGGGDTEEAWKAQVVLAGDLRQSAGDARQRLAEYATVHQEIRDRDDAGDWEGAVTLAVATGTGSANAAFGQYAQDTDQALAARSQAAADGLNSNTWLLSLVAVLLMVAGVATAIAGWFGVSLRMGEYR